MNAHIIFIDSTCDYFSVKTNLNKFWKLLKINGYIFGDNYNILETKQAIDEFSDEVNISITLNENIWILKKNNT